jgi:hypothetical protein
MKSSQSSSGHNKLRRKGSGFSPSNGPNRTKLNLALEELKVAMKCPHRRRVLDHLFGTVVSSPQDSGPFLDSLPRACALGCKSAAPLGLELGLRLGLQSAICGAFWMVNF